MMWTLIELVTQPNLKIALTVNWWILKWWTVNTRCYCCNASFNYCCWLLFKSSTSNSIILPLLKYIFACNKTSVYYNIIFRLIKKLEKSKLKILLEQSNSQWATAENTSHVLCIHNLCKTYRFWLKISMVFSHGLTPSWGWPMGENYRWWM